jgi:phage head maturation protease
MDLQQMQMQDNVQWRSKHSLVNSYTRRTTLVEIGYTGIPAVKASMVMAV